MNNMTSPRQFTKKNHTSSLKLKNGRAAANGGSSSNIVYAQRSRNNRIKMNQDGSSATTDLQNYYNPQSSMPNNKCQILYTQPMGMGSSLHNISKTQDNQSFEALTSPKIKNKSTEKLPTSHIHPTMATNMMMMQSHQ